MAGSVSHQSLFGKFTACVVMMAILFVSCPVVFGQGVDELLGKGQVAMTEGDYAQAKGYFEAALKESPADEQALMGLSAATYHLRFATGATSGSAVSSILTRTSATRAVQAEALKAEWGSVQGKVAELMNEGEYGQAMDLLGEMSVSLSSKRYLFDAETMLTLQREVGTLKGAVRQAEKASSNDSYVAVQQVATRAEQSRLAVVGQSQGDRVAYLLKLVKQYQKDGQLELAIMGLDQVLTVEPGNPYATYLKGDLQDALFMARQRRGAAVASREEANVLVGAREDATAWSENYRLPEDWQEKTIKRGVGAVPVEGGAVETPATRVGGAAGLIDLNYADAELQDVINDFRQIPGLERIVPVWGDLEEKAGISPEDTVTIQLPQVTPGKALDLVLELVSADKLGRAGYWVDDEGIIKIQSVGEEYEYKLENYYIADIVDRLNGTMNGGNMMGGGGMGMGMMGGSMGMGMSGMSGMNSGFGSGRGFGSSNSGASSNRFGNSNRGGTGFGR